MLTTEEKLPFKTKVSLDTEEKNVEQKDLTPQKEPDTKIIDFSGSINYLSMYDDSNYSDKNQLMGTYREMAQNFEISEAIDEIENEAVVVENDESISINTDRLDYSDSIKEKINEEFKTILQLLKWNTEGFGLFRQWFIDGRIYLQKVMSKNLKNGIQKIVKLDSLKVDRYKKKDTGEIFYQYKYNEDKTYIIPQDGITYTNSGITDPSHNYYISELHKSMRPLNNHRLIDDSALIYYITRAPQKRAFYIDVGNTPTAKAEEKVRKMMQKLRQRISYDSTTGKVIQQKRSIPVNEDYYFAARGDTRGTRIESIEGDTSLLDPEIMNYYKKKLYKSLGVPFSRIDDDSGSMIDFSNTSEMSRQELKFTKQTNKRRKRFSKTFDDLLKTQLIAKKIITNDEWDKIKHSIVYVWKSDSYIAMTKQQDILSKQLDLAIEMQPYVGLYYSHDYIMTEVFKFNDETKEAMRKEIEEEKNDSFYQSKENEEEF